MKRYSVLLLALALVSCDKLPGAGPKAPTGVAGEAAQNVAALIAPGADIADWKFEDFLADLDLARTYGSAGADELSGQLRRTRATAATAAKSNTGTAGGRLAGVMGLFGVFIVPEFAQSLADALDPFTSGKGGGQAPARPPKPSTEEGPNYTTVTTINITSSLSAESSRVTLTMHWTYRSISKEKSSGKTLFEIGDDRNMVGALTVCPNAAGESGATVDVQSKFTSVSSTATGVTRTTTSSSVFTGYVSDSAALQRVQQTHQDKQSWDTPTGKGEFSSITSSSYDTSSGMSDTIGAFDSSSFSGSFNASDAAAAASMAKHAAFDIILDAFAMGGPYRAAQKLWRGGRCVVVRSEDYNAETPIEVAAQEKSQHDEEVAGASETKLGVNLKHRFDGGALSLPVTAALTSGAKTVEPNRLSAVPGSVTYKAPDEDGKKATVMLRSTSKRGIGTLVLDFHTGGALSLTITGELTGNSSNFGVVVKILDTVTIGPLQFKKTFGDVYEGTGSWRAELSSYTTTPSGSDTCTGTESGTVSMMARVETRGDKKVWVLDPLDAMADGKGSEECVNSLGGTTLRGVTLPTKVTREATGDSADIFIGMLNEIVIPGEGGRVAVRGSASGAGRGEWSASGTAVGVTKKQ